MAERRLIRTRSAVAELRAAGLSVTRIAEEIRVSKSTVCYHLRRLGEPADERCNRRYDWDAVQRYYDAGNSISQCMRHFGMARATFMAAVRRGAITTRPQKQSIDDLLRRPNVNRDHLRRRLIAEGLKDARCECCGLSSWLGRPIPLQLHHVNGVGDDNRLENLQVLCANCHSQTDSWGGRNKGRLRLAADPVDSPGADAA